METVSETLWLEDANHNRASIEYFGTREAAQAALDGLDDNETALADMRKRAEGMSDA